MDETYLHEVVVEGIFKVVAPGEEGEEEQERRDGSALRPHAPSIGSIPGLG